MSVLKQSVQESILSINTRLTRIEIYKVKESSESD